MDIKCQVFPEKLETLLFRELLKQQYHVVWMVASKSTTLLLQFAILCMPVTCKVINEILKFGSSSRQRERGGGLHYISAALAPTQSNVASESKLPDEMDRFFFIKLSQFCTKAAQILNKFTTMTLN